VGETTRADKLLFPLPLRFPSMQDDLASKMNGQRRIQLAWPVIQIAAIWSVSDIGFYFLLPVLGQQPSYNAASIASALYYVFWIGIAVITFWPLYTSWALYTKWTTFENRWTSYAVWSFALAGCILFATYLLPMLPAPQWTQSWSPPEVRDATPWYFLPKSIEILLQQLLVLALVLALAAQRYSLKKISVYCAVAFGIAHILLAFTGVPPGYVVRFMVAATAFGFAFPYLILRVPNGLLYAYIVHWLYYALTALTPRLVFSS
jgi:hypothetical protein